MEVSEKFLKYILNYCEFVISIKHIIANKNSINVKCKKAYLNFIIIIKLTFMYSIIS